MKDKLRDYADRLERGEPWMHKGAKFTKWIKEVVSDMRNDADKIDAEGDDGAAWWTTKDGAEPITTRLEAANALLRKCRDEFARLPHSLGYDFTHLPEIDAHLSEPRTPERPE